MRDAGKAVAAGAALHAVAAASRSGRGAFAGKWGGIGSAPGQLIQPRGMAIDSAGNVYLGDSQNSRVQKFRPRAAGC